MSASAIVARHRFALTRRQMRARITHLKTTRDRLTQQATRHQAETDRRIKTLERRLAAADELITEQQHCINAHVVDLGVLRQQLAAQQTATRTLTRDLIAAQAALAERNKVSVPPMIRDVDEQPTIPIPVRTLQQAFGGPS